MDDKDKELVKQSVDLQAVLNVLAKEEDINAPVKRTSKQVRMEKYKGGQDIIDVEVLVALFDTMRAFVEEKFAKVAVTEERLLTTEEINSLMSEYIDSQTISEALQARREETKRMVFNHLTARNVEDNIEEPDNHNGFIEAPDYGKKFCREGTGYTDPQIDEDTLKGLLPRNDWEKITTTTKIPAQTIVKIDDSKLMKYLQDDPEKMELIRQSLVRGKKKTPRFQVRDI